MFTCPHVHWLELVGVSRSWCLIEPARLRLITNEFADSRNAYPSIVFFVGTRSKTATIKAIFNQNNPSRRHAHAIANLHVDLNTVNSEHPIIFADCTLKSTPASSVGCWNGCCEKNRCVMHEEGGFTGTKVDDVISLIHANLIFPFTQAVCVFADDFGGNDSCARYIDSWLRFGASPVESEARNYPQLIVVTTDYKTDALIQVECHPRFHLVFDSLTIETSARPTDLAAQSLRTRLRSILDDISSHRQERQLLLNAADLVGIFSRAVRQFALRPTKPVSIFACSDHPAASLPSITGHLEEFHLAMAHSKAPRDAVVDFIATALLVAGYPSHLHRELVYGPVFSCLTDTADFHPTLVFDHLFRDHLCQYRFPPGFHSLNGIRQQFLGLFCSLDRRDSALTLRKQVLKSHRSIWRHLNSSTKCFLCMLRPSERMLACGHSLCEECIEAYYPPGRGVYTYVVWLCYFCGENARVILAIKPPTVEPNVATIDGGGVRGIVALVLLKQLKVALDSQHDIRDYFDFFAGTSAGGLIVLDHVVCGSSLEASIERFQVLSGRIFPRKHYGPLSFLQRLFDWLAWWCTDNKYDSGILEDVVQEAFGLRQCLFGHSSQHQTGIKVVVTATTAAQSQLRLFTNYNGVARNRQGKGYATLRPREPWEEPRVWEVARCAAAAPGYFRPKVLGHFGALQDGAMKRNNPTEPALLELRCVWPDHQWPHFLLSIGTGHAKSMFDVSNYRGTWLDGFVVRVLRAFFSSPSIDAENSWIDLLDRLDDKYRNRFHRLTHEFEGTVSELDDKSQIPKLIQAVTDAGLSLESEREKLWASRFFFELQAQPERIQHYYVIHGVIFCRFADARSLLQAIRRAYPYPKIMIKSRTLVDLAESHGLCESCGYYRHKISFEVDRLSEDVEITLTFNLTRRSALASFPKPMDWFLGRQMKHGRWNHWIGPANCCERSKRGATSSLERDNKRQKTQH